MSIVRRASICAALALCVAADVDAQRASNRAQNPNTALTTELALVRDATAAEMSGNFAEAERLLGQVLDANPISLSGLLTLERVLTVQNRLREIEPAVDRLLATDPVSVIGHQMRLRVASASGDAGRIESAAAQWIRAVPHLETPYREVAALWRTRSQPAKAISVLEQGRKRIDRPDALALELGDAYLASGDFRRAAEEWSRAVGQDGRGFMLVQRRLQSLPDGGARVIPQLVERLAQKPVAYSRLRAAAMLAVDAGLDGAVSRLLPELAGAAPLAEREPMLVELARRADGAGLHRVALAAYAQLLAGAREPSSALAIRSRIAELALLSGDTTLAAQTYRELEAAAAAGSPQRRQAVALRIQLTAREGALDRAATDLEAFRTEYPQASELDEAAALVSSLLLADGRMDDAERVLAGVHGPRSSQMRGRLYLRRGDIAKARDELMGAAPHLRGRDATETIALAALLTRLSARGGELLARFAAGEHASREEGLRVTAEAARALTVLERAAIFDFLAAAADASGSVEDAAALRREIVETMPRAQEAPAALLALARGAQGAQQVDEARVLLEKLIVDYPRSALAPQARAELQRLTPR